MHRKQKELQVECKWQLKEGIGSAGCAGLRAGLEEWPQTNAFVCCLAVCVKHKSVAIAGGKRRLSKPLPTQVLLMNTLVPTSFQQVPGIPPKKGYDVVEPPLFAQR